MTDTGRRAVFKKMTVDEALSLDMLFLQRKGVFSRYSGQNITCIFSRGGYIALRMHSRFVRNPDGPSSLDISYTFDASFTGTAHYHNQTVGVVSTPCNYGGVRWWFLCPTDSDKNCVQRCRILYLPHEHEETAFGCRECHRLTYESRQRHREGHYENLEKPLMRYAKRELA